MPKRLDEIFAEQLKIYIKDKHDIEIDELDLATSTADE